MREILLAAILVASLAAVAAAQNSTKYEGFAGFSIASFDTGLGGSGIVGGNDRETALGFDTSATGYLTDHFGIEGNFDGHFKKKTFTFPGFGTVDARLDSFNFMGGPHYRFSSTGKVTPFVRALAGGRLQTHRPRMALARPPEVKPEDLPELTSAVLDDLMNGLHQLFDEDAEVQPMLEAPVYGGLAGVGLELLHHVDRPGVRGVLETIGARIALAMHRIPQPCGQALRAPRA